MTLLAVSVSHHTAGLEVVAQASMSSDVQREVERELLLSPVVAEAMVLSTCNRTEIFVDTNRFHVGLDAIADALTAHTGVDVRRDPELCHVSYDEAAIAHSFALTAGLTSLVLGENQILGQVRETLNAAQQAGHTGPVLNRTFQAALKAGKRVHSETQAGHAGRSVLSEAMITLDNADVDLPSGSRVLVVGAGPVATAAALVSRDRDWAVTIVNRTTSRAQSLAEQVGGRWASLENLTEEIPLHDLVITCTGASGELIGPSDIAGPDHEPSSLDHAPANVDSEPEEAEVPNPRRPRAIVDIAMPPDVDPAVGELLTLINLNNLDSSSRLSSEAIEAAQELVDEELQKFLRRRRSAAVTPTVVALRDMGSSVVNSEYDRLVRRLPNLDDDAQNEIANALRRVADKLLHRPTVTVREQAAIDTGADGADYAAVLRELFALETDELGPPNSDSLIQRGAQRDPNMQGSLGWALNHEATEQLPKTGEF